MSFYPLYLPHLGTYCSCFYQAADVDSGFADDGNASFVDAFNKAAADAVYARLL